MRLRIEKLYGRFTYDMVFPDSGVTILTGPNGFGKSTLLRCIQAVHESDLAFFTGLDHVRFSLSSDDENERFDLARVNQLLFEINGKAYRRSDLRRYSREPSGISSASAQFLQTTEKYVQHIGGAAQKKDNEDIEGLSALLRKMPLVTGRVSLIKEQRLLTETVERKSPFLLTETVRGTTEAISGIPESFLGLLNQTMREYSAVATKLDSLFLRRLINSSEKDTFSEADFIREYTDTKRKLDTLRENGISNFPELGELNYQAKNASAFRIFFDDFNQKYAVYAPLMEKMTLYRNIVNKRLRFKKLSYSEKGIEIRNDSGSPLLLEQLSSGEKELLLLYFRLIFQTEPNMRILIDEPEISLHIAWQQKFVPDLKKIAKLNNFSAIIATHSPFISDSVAAAKYDLGEIYKNGRTKADEG